MALIIEDGSIVANANSYQAVQDLRDYATARGEDLSALDDAAVSALLIKAMDYLQSLGSRYKGERVSATQDLDWPRTGAVGVVLPSAIFPSDEIPRGLQIAQLALAFDAQTTDLMPNRLPGDSGAVKREKVDVIEVEYAGTATQHYTPFFAKAQAHLNDLLERKGLFAVRA